jgi:hypothetical protein
MNYAILEVTNAYRAGYYGPLIQRAHNATQEQNRDLISEIAEASMIEEYLEGYLAGIEQALNAPTRD